MEDRKSPFSILYLQSSTFSGWLVFFISSLLADHQPFGLA